MGNEVSRLQKLSTVLIVYSLWAVYKQMTKLDTAEPENLPILFHHIRLPFQNLAPTLPTTQPTQPLSDITGLQLNAALCYFFLICQSIPQDL